MKTLTPLVELLRANVMTCDLLHADDTPIRVLDRSKARGELGKGVNEGRILGPCPRPVPLVGDSTPGRGLLLLARSQG